MEKRDLSRFCFVVSYTQTYAKMLLTLSLPAPCCAGVFDVSFFPGPRTAIGSVFPDFSKTGKVIPKLFSAIVKRIKLPIQQKNPFVDIFFQTEVIMLQRWLKKKVFTAFYGKYS